MHAPADAQPPCMRSRLPPHPRRPAVARRMRCLAVHLTHVLLTPRLLTNPSQPNGEEAKVVTADLRADGAIVHLIDLVLTPPEEAEKPAEPATPSGEPGSGPCTYTVGGLGLGWYG